MAEGDEEIDDMVPPSSGNGKVFIGLALGLLLGAGGGFAGSQFMGGAEAAVIEGEETEDGVDVAGENDRVVIPMDPFTVNLRGSGGGRVLKVEVQLQVDKKDETRILNSVAQMRDATISLASDYTFTELEGIDGKMHFRDELLGRINRILEGPRVQRIYFTQFVVR